MTEAEVIEYGVAILMVSLFGLVCVLIWRDLTRDRRNR
jgi:hypothetical protein